MIGDPLDPDLILSECQILGVVLRVDASGGLVVDGPASTLTTDLLERLRQNKPAIVRALVVADMPGRLELDDSGWPIGSLPIEAVDPCPRCGRYELWETILSRRWRCMGCDPPKTARRAVRLAGRLRGKL